ncbi:MAG: helix-turn-helix domain-containing protein [Nitrospirota bacterium]
MMRTSEDRCQSNALRRAGITQAALGQALGVSQATVSRELARNTGQRSDHVQQAPRTAQSRQQPVRHQPRTLTLRVRCAIARKLGAERWSQESISFWLRAERGVALSPEWIDRMIWDNNRAGGDRWRFLRRRPTHPRRAQKPVHDHLDIAPSNRHGHAPRHGASAKPVARPRPHHHLRQREGVYREGSASKKDSMAASSSLLYV